MTREKRSWFYFIYFFSSLPYKWSRKNKKKNEMKEKKNSEIRMRKENSKKKMFPRDQKSWKAINLEFICSHKLTHVCRAVKHGRSIKIAKHAIFDSKSDTCDFHLFKIMDLNIQWRQMNIFCFQFSNCANMLMGI
jgi:hypothetical protein